MQVLRWKSLSFDDIADHDRSTSKIDIIEYFSAAFLSKELQSEMGISIRLWLISARSSSRFNELISISGDEMERFL